MFCVPLYGTQLEGLPVISYEQLSALLELFFPWMATPTHADGTLDSPPQSITEWVDAQSDLLIGRFVKYETTVTIGATQYRTYGFEVESVEKGGAEWKAGDLLTLRISYGLWDASQGAIFPTPYFPEPQLGQRVLISAAQIGGVWEMARAGRQVTVFNLLDDTAVPRQWRAEQREVPAVHVYLRCLEYSAYSPEALKRALD